MGKRKTFSSELWQHRCVLPMRKSKKQASKCNETDQFVKYAVIEDYCIKQRDIHK
ncbi:MAG: hypothetical protein ACW9W4_01190 [Candidatus Nitrosopumilus sp. bin_7KS]